MTLRYPPNAELDYIALCFFVSMFSTARSKSFVVYMTYMTDLGSIEGTPFEHFVENCLLELGRVERHSHRSGVTMHDLKVSTDCEARLHCSPLLC